MNLPLIFLGQADTYLTFLLMQGYPKTFILCLDMDISSDDPLSDSRTSHNATKYHRFASMKHDRRHRVHHPGSIDSS
ncbi:hypothetical protein QVD17_19230 [Tagetes erecta]|uniref:Uncharacterized protein n=1 Tax=Tagetes erecta TaxID=13708 RepID=A0AAD8NX31_TARER|nr:hypothetical protein QVD17_19230 [Tagetes erecta]